MKNIVVRTVIVLIVSMFGVVNAFAAQADSTDVDAGPTGKGFFQPGFQYVKGIQNIERNFIRNYVAGFSGDYKYMRPDIPGDDQGRASQKDVIDRVGHYINEHSSKKLTYLQIAALFKSSALTFQIWSPKMFKENGYRSYYFDENGQLQLWDPTTSSVFGEKDGYVIARLKLPGGSTIYIKADCGNLVDKVYEDEHFPPHTASMPAPNPAPSNPAPTSHKIYFTASPNNIMAGDSVTLHWDASGYSRVDISGIGDHLDPSGNFMVSPDRTTTYFLRAYPGNCPANVIVYVKQKDLQVSTKGWFCRNAGWVVPVGIVVIAGVVYVACHHPAPRDHVYSTEIQDTSGQPGLGGDGGGSTHTYAAQISKGFGLTTHWTANAGFVSFTPNQAGKIKPVLGVHFAFALR